MAKPFWRMCLSLRVRMLLSFISLLSLVVIVTLFTVQTATYSHSTGQVVNHASTSAEVVSDQLLSRGKLLKESVTTYFQEYTTLRVLAGGRSDPESLIPVLRNHQRRSNGDITWVLSPQGELIASSNNLPVEELSISPERYQDDSVRFHQLGGAFYLLKAVPIRFVAKSPTVSVWVFMGISVDKLINQRLVELTDMQVSLLNFQQATQVIATTMGQDLGPWLVQQNLSRDPGLHGFTIGEDDYLYTLTHLGYLGDVPLSMMLATPENEAYLSYNSLLLQLFALIGVVTLIAFFAAIALSGGITRPVSALVNIAHRISGGDYVERFPKTNIDEVSSLTNAVSDMQNNIRKREAQIQKLAYFDELTGLPNRVQFSDELAKRLEHCKENRLFVLMLDLDRFKDINDTLGHELGDELLNAVAKRLNTAGYEGAFIARLGGDEFGVIIDCGGAFKVDDVAETFAKLFEQPFIIDSLVLSVETSIGIGVYPYDAEDVSGLMQCADIALYSCKGKHYPYAVYKPELNQHSVQRLSLMHDLKAALAEDQLYLHYQPKLSIENGNVETVECLIRWQHPEHGFVPPDEFIPLAEQTGAIREITKWALNKALAQQKAWRDQGHAIGIAVNISAVDLVDLELPALVSDLLAEYQTAAEDLILEVTESAVMSDPESAVRALKYLRRMGIVLSVDDFGTGYSSMAQLKKMPVKELKIDKAFVLDLATNEEDQVMVKTLVSLASNLGLQTVAEGVEDEASLQLLKEMGCTKAQGFHLSRPLDAEKLTAWLSEFQQSQASVQSA